jgi:NADPH:quinone reductase-like Zn-dependent oxidoreductase
MTALRAHRRGGPEVLVVEGAPVPVPAAGEVLVAVHAAAIVDRTPVIPSLEVSGVVSDIASGVVDSAPGDEGIRTDRLAHLGCR